MTTEMHAFTLGKQKETDNTLIELYLRFTSREFYIYVHHNQHIRKRDRPYDLLFLLSIIDTICDRYSSSMLDWMIEVTVYM